MASVSFLFAVTPAHGVDHTRGSGQVGLPVGRGDALPAPSQNHCAVCGNAQRDLGVDGGQRFAVLSVAHALDEVWPFGAIVPVSFVRPLSSL